MSLWIIVPKIYDNVLPYNQYFTCMKAQKITADHNKHKRRNEETYMLRTNTRIFRKNIYFPITVDILYCLHVYAQCQTIK